MQFATPSSPHIHSGKSIATLMQQVMWALVPGILALVWFFGWGVVVQIVLAVAVALMSEAAMLAARGRPVRPFLLDGSAVLTGLLLAVSLPPLSPWWLTTVGTGFAIIVAKQLYGGLGYNPFNPAMVGYVLLLISFPREMTTWVPAELLTGHRLGFGEAAAAILGGVPPALPPDAVSAATPLDNLRMQIGLGKSVDQATTANPAYGMLGGAGWEWVNAAFLAGGLWMLSRRTITWHIPAGMLGALFAIATIFHLINPERYADPTFHLFSGAAMLGAFFIATDPITASTTVKGRVIYGAGIGVFTYIIRTWGGYPDGVAFSVLLMNLAAPTIDYYTRPQVFGRKGGA